MGKEDVPEVVDREIEVIPNITLNQSRIDAMIQFSEQSERFGRALDNNRKFALNRAWNGDFVQHGDKVNVTGPGAERVLSAYAQMGVPVSFLNWEYHKDTGTDKYGDWYTWWYSADVEIGGFKSKIEGRAGTRDSFFGREDNKWKDTADIKEADIRMAARRCVFKEAAKVALGLRSIPADQAESLGLKTSIIKKVEFGKRGQSEAVTTKPGEALTIKEVKQFQKKDGDKIVWTRYDVLVNETEAKFSTFDKKVADYAKECQAGGVKVVINYEASAKGNTITEVVPFHEEAAS